MKSRSTLRKFALLASTSCALIAPHNGAFAQTVTLPQPPTNSIPDDRSIDLMSGQLIFSLTPLTIGTASNGLVNTLYFPGLYGFRHEQMITATADDYDANGVAHGAHITIAFGRSASGFTLSGSTYTPDKADGSTLTFATNQWTYTDRDGTVILLDRTQGSAYTTYYDTTNYYGGADGIATSITRPDGYTTRLTYKKGSYVYSANGVSATIYPVRLQSANTSTGYQLKFGYRNNTLSQATAGDWTQFAQVSAINNGVDYCDPTADSCSGLTQSWPTVTYGASGSVLSITDPVGRTSSYTFDTSGRIIGARKPSSASDNVSYNYLTGSSAISSIGIANVGTWNYSFSLNTSTMVLSGSVTTPTVPTPLSFTANYTIRQPLTVTDQNGHQTSYAYDGNGRITQKTLDGTGSNYSTFSYDGRGNLLSEIRTPKSGSGLATLTASATYPSSCTTAATCNKPITTTDSAGQVTNYYYNSNGTLDYVQAPAPTSGGVRPETHYSYIAVQAWFKNSAGSIVTGPDTVTLPTGSTTCVTGAWGCTAANQIIAQTNYYGGPTATNLLVSSTVTKNGSGTPSATTAYTYDNIGNVISSTDPVSNITTYTYAADRQMLTTMSPSIDGSGTSRRRQTVYHYNSDGLRDSASTGSVNPDGSGFTVRQVRYSAYDVASRKVVDGLTDGTTTYSLTQYSYNGANRLDCMAVRMNPAAFGSLPSSACTSGTQGSYGPDRITHYIWEYAGALDRTQSAYGIGGLQRDDVHYTRTNHNLTESMTDPNGNVTYFAYDGHDRLLRTCYQGTLSACQAGSSSDYVQLGYDAAGHPVSKSIRGAPTSLVGYTYDNLGRITNVSYPGAGQFDQPVTLVYDNLGRKLSATDGAGHSATFGYDALGNVTSQGDAISARTMLYDAAGRRTRLTWSDGRYVTFSYNGASDLTAILESGTTSLAAFAYDDVGRRSTLTRGNGVVTTYSGYTPLGVGSLFHDLTGTANDVTFAYSYNPAGQIISRTTTSANSKYTFGESYVVNRSYTANGLNQYTASGAVTPTYDAKGNLTSAGTPVYSYSTKNELTMRSDTGTKFYRDPLGQMDSILNSSGSVTQGFQYLGGQISTELGTPAAGNPILRRYVFGSGADEPIIWYEGADFTTKRYMIADERGSIVAVTDASGNPATINSQTAINSYDEYGIPASTNQGRFQYTGQPWMAELGMYDYKARIYSPTLGRFLQTDPSGYPNGPHLYAYTNNDPINNIDPTGMTVVCAGVEPDVTCSDVGGSSDSGGGYGDFSDYGGDDFDYSDAANAAIQAELNAMTYSANLRAAQIAGGRQTSQADKSNQQPSNNCLGNITGDTWAGLGLDAIGVGASLTGLKPAYALGSAFIGIVAGYSSMQLGVWTGSGQTLGLGGLGTGLTYAGTLDLGKQAASNLPVVGALAAVGTMGYDAFSAFKGAGCFK